MLCPKATGKNIAEQHCSLVFLAEPQAISRVQELVAFSGKKGKSDSKHIVFFFAPQLLILASLAPLASLGSF